MEKRTKDKPWKLKTPPQTSDYEMYIDTKDGKEIIVCTVGTTVLHYDYRGLADLHAMLKSMATGWNWAAKMRNRKLSKAQWNIGHARRKIRSAAGMGLRKASRAASACTFHL